MRFKLETDLNDGLGNVAPLTAEITSLDQLYAVLADELASDEGVTIPVGATVLITREA